MYPRLCQLCCTLSVFAGFCCCALLLGVFIEVFYWGLVLRFCFCCLSVLTPGSMCCTLPPLARNSRIIRALSSLVVFSGSLVALYHLSIFISFLCGILRLPLLSLAPGLHTLGLCLTHLRDFRLIHRLVQCPHECSLILYAFLVAHCVYCTASRAQSQWFCLRVANAV